MIVELSVVPIGVGESLSQYVAKALEILEKAGVKYDLNPMGTCFEIESFDELAEILRQIDQALAESPRNYYVVKIDKRARGGRMDAKVKSVLEKLK